MNDARTLNLVYGLPERVWGNMPALYSRMEGWLGFGDGHNGEHGVAYWFGYTESETCIYAITSPSGLELYAHNISQIVWETWLDEFKAKATAMFGFEVEEIDAGGEQV